MKIEISNGRLIDPAQGIDKKTSLFIAAGKIAAIGAAPPAWHANRVIDAAGMIVCPGLIDISARLREPGFEYKATFGYHVWLRPQDAHLSRGGVAHDGEVAMRLGLPAIPACAETIALGTIFALARVTGSPVHLARLSTHEGVACVREAKREGLGVTCDVAINHLHLCDADIG